MHRTFTVSKPNSRVFIACLLSFMTLIAPMASVGAATLRASAPPASKAKKQVPATETPNRFAPVPLAAPMPKPAPEPGAVVSTITATKVDAFADSDGDGKAEPGETITYTATITNSGPDPATHLKFIDTIDTHTTLVPGSVNTSPIAANDAYTASGNIQISVPVASGVKANDIDPDNGSNAGLNVTQVQGAPGNVGVATDTTAVGLGGVKGSVTMAVDGSFTYEPPPGFEGADTFTYQISDGTATDTATVTINITGMVWFISNIAGGLNRGTFTNPFTTIASFNTANALASAIPNPKIGDFISLRTGIGTYTETDGINLKNTQKLIGNAVQFNTVFTASANSSAAYTTFAGGTGTAPSIVTTGGDGVDLAADNTVRGLNVGNTPGFFAFDGAAVGSPIVNTVAIISAGARTGGAINVSTSGAFGSNVTFSTLESTSSPTSNINLVSVTGTLAVTAGGDGLSGSSTTGNGVTINGGSVTLNYPGSIDKANAGSLVNVTNHASPGTLSFPGTLSATGVSTGNGLQFNNADGNYNFNGTTTLNGGDAGIDITTGSAGTFTFNANSSITSPTNELVLISGGTQNFTYSGSFSKGSGSRGIFISSNTGGTILFDGASATETKTITATGSNNAVDLENNSGTSIINFTGNNLLLASGNGNAFEATGGGTITVQGTGNTLTTTGTGTALNVANTFIGLSGLTFLSINSTAAGTNGIVLNTTGTTAGTHGGLTVSGSGTTAGSGGTIQSKDQGALFTSTINVNLKNMNFTNANTGNGVLNNVDNSTFNSGAKGAINMSSVTTATFENLAITNTVAGGQVGINGQNVSAFTLKSSTLTNWGDANLEGSVRFFNLTGTCLMENNTMTFAAENMVDIRNDSSTALNLTVQGNPLGTSFNTFDNTFTSATGGYLFIVTGVSNALANLTFKSNKFLNMKTAGLATRARGNSTINLNVTGSGTDANGNQFDPVGTDDGVAMDLTAEDTADFNFNINDNFKIYGRGGPTINVLSINTAIVNGRINSNGDIRSTFGQPGSQMQLRAQDDSTGIIEVKNNVITNVGANPGIVANSLGDGVGGASDTATLDITIESNAVTVPADAANSVGAIDTRSGPNAGDVTKTCVDILNNTVNLSDAADVAWIVRIGSVGSFLYLEGMSAGATNQARAENTWIARGNTPAVAAEVASVDAAGAPAYSAPPAAAPYFGVCRTPSHPTAFLNFTDDKKTYAGLNPVGSAAGASDGSVASSSVASSTVKPPINQTVAREVKPAAVKVAEVAPLRAKTLSHHASFKSRKPNSLNSRANSSPMLLAGETVTIDGGAGVSPANSGFTLPANKTITVTFQVTVNNPPNLTFPYVGGSPRVINQGTVTADGGISVLTDDTAVGGANDPTVTLVDLFNSQTTVAPVPTSGTTTTSITLTATVKIDPAQVPTPAVDTDPTGTVKFQDGGVDIAGCTAQPLTGTVNPNESTATCTTTFTPSGTHPITAIYSADGNYDASTSGASNVTIIDPPTVAKSFAVPSIPLGTNTTMSFLITNPNSTPLTGIGFQDTLPAGLSVVSATTPQCGGTVATTVSSVTFSGGTVAGSSNCTVNVTVKGEQAGTWSNQATSVTSTEGGPGVNSNTAMLDVVAPPVAAKSFNPTNTTPGGNSTLTIQITNPSGNTVPLTGVNFTDTFPAGITIAATPNASTTCAGGTLTDPADGPLGGGDTGIKMVGATIPTNSSCTVTVDVTATTGGLNSVTVNSTNGGTGNTATATLTTCIAPPTGMTNWWTGDDTARDIAGGKDGTLNGDDGPADLEYSAGKVLNGFDFDGINDLVNVGDVDLPSTFTIDAWVNPTDLSIDRAIVSKDDGAAQRSYFFHITSTGALQASVNSAGGLTVYQTADGVITAGSLQHVAVTYDGAAGAGAKMLFYKNGVLVASTVQGGQDAGGVPENNALAALIGRSATTNNTFLGVIDEVEFFSSVLSAAELLAIFNADAGGKCKPSDLTVTKTHSGSFNQGSTGNTYTITVHNDGPAPTSGTTTVTDTLPAGLTATAMSGSGWTCAPVPPGPFPVAGPATLQCTSTDAIASGADFPVITLTVSVGANMPSASNIVTVSGGGELDTSDDTATDPTTLTPVADLQITKTDGSPTEVPGTGVTYTITVTNAGPSNVTGATVADTFPGILTGVTYNSSAGGGATGNTSGSGNIADTVDMPSGSTITYTVNATIASSATGSLSNVATVTAPGGTTDPDTANNSATDTDTLSVVADLAITKTDGVTDETPGTSVSYTITVTNNGPSDVIGASVADTFPAAITGVTYTSVAAGGATGNTAGPTAGNINDTVNMPSGSSITYTASGTISSSATGTLDNTATVTAPGGVTDAGGNNSATDSDTLTPGADLQITKTDGAASEVPGTSITYTIVVTNAGPSDVTGAIVADTFPAALTGVSYTSVTTGTVTGNTAGPAAGNINNTVNMTSGSTITYTVNATIDPAATGSLTNTATVTAPAGTNDADTSNNTATDTDTLTVTADLSITKTDGAAGETPGTTVTYTIVVTNNGPSNVTGATVSDNFPGTITGVTYTSVASMGVTGNTAGPAAGNINDTVNMISGATITYTATGTIAASASGSLSNTATVTAPGGVTDAAGNNSATDTDTLTGSADLAVTKTDTPDPATAGENITYTINFVNNGPSDAQTVTVTDAVPANTTFVSASVTTGTGWSTTSPAVGGTGNVVFSKGTVAAGETATFTMVVKVNSNTAAATTITNTVTAASATADPDGTNNSDTETTTVITSADLLVVKVESEDPVAAGANLTYTITLTNGGSSDAQTLSLSDTLPAFTTFVSFAAPAGWTTVTPAVGGTGTVTATKATLASGDSAVFTLVVNVNLATPHNTVLSNTASVTTSTTDPNMTNNSSTEMTTVIALPDANDDAYFGLKDQVFNIPAPGVLSNDTGPNLVVTPVVGGATTAGGTYTINANGSFTYTPPAGFSGTDGFNYTVTNPAGSDTAHVELTVTDPATIALRISEFRFNGPNGATDEFFEIYNASPTAHQVGGTSLSNSGGYGLFASAGNGVTSNTVTLVCLIPNGTVIPARGYILCTGSSYSLAALGAMGSNTGSATTPTINGAASTSVGNFPVINGTVAQPGVFTSADVPNDAGLLLANVGTNTVGASSDVGNGTFGFSATGVAAGNFTVWDRVGFAPYGAGAPLQTCQLANPAGCGPSGSARPSLADNYCEGGAAGCLRPVGDASTTNHGTAVFYGDSGQYSLLRRQTIDLSATIGTVPQDTANNGEDFVMVSPTPGINIAFTITNFPTGVGNGLVSVLGAAGPQNNAAPSDLAETRLQSSLFDPSRTSAQLPNAERRYVLDNTLTTIPNNPMGSFIFRFGFRNMSSASDINRLRVRVDNLSVLCGQSAPPAGTGTVGSGNARNLSQTSPNCQGTDNKTAILKMLNMPTELVAPENGPVDIVRGSVIEDTDGTKLAPNGGGINNSLVRTGTAPGNLTGEFTTVVPAGSPGPRFFIAFRMGVVKGGSFRFLFQPEGSSTTPVPAPTVP